MSVCCGDHGDEKQQGGASEIRRTLWLSKKRFQFPKPKLDGNLNWPKEPEYHEHSHCTQCNHAAVVPTIPKITRSVDCTLKTLADQRLQVWGIERARKKTLL
eukprot:4853197-Amphidinium_carterae.1